MSNKRHSYSSSIGEIADTISMGIRWEKRFSDGITDEEKIELEQELVDWGTRRFYLERSQSFAHPTLKKTTFDRFV